MRLEYGGSSRVLHVGSFTDQQTKSAQGGATKGVAGPRNDASRDSLVLAEVILFHPAENDTSDAESSIVVELTVALRVETK